MLKGTLLFLIGVFVGANIVYFVMTRDAAPSDGAAVSRPLVATAPTRTPAAVEPGAAAEPGASAPQPPAPTPPPAMPRSATVTPAGVVLAPSGLALPLPNLQPAQLVDTYEQARGSDRRHDAIDILAPAGTPVLAVTDGHVEKLFSSEQGGLTLYQFEPSGRYVYYYAHLQGYAPGVVEGKALKRGELIGYVGSTGNANPAAPHLHFAISVLGPERKWWKATPVNPYPLLGGKPSTVPGQTSPGG